MNPRTVRNLSIALFVLLLLWGCYATLVYFGVPVHGAALLSEALQGGLSPETCAAKDNLCYLARGAGAIFPVIWHTIARAMPFFGYVAVCAVAFAGAVLWRRAKGDGRTVRFSWTPWKVVLLFVGALWLLSMTLSYGTSNGRPVRLFVEPTAETYDVSPAVLEILRDDYQRMLARGCLSPVGETVTGAALHNLTPWCMQVAFVERVATQVLFVLVLLFEFLVLGRAALHLMKIRPKELLHEALLSAALGAGAWIVILWCVAIAGVYVTAAGWIAAIAVPAALFPHSRYWLERFLYHRWETAGKWYDPALLLLWLLGSLVALNFLEVIRPFPIGWDDLGSYLNRPRLLVSYGEFIYSMSPFDWSYLTSLGFLLFGYDNPFGSTSSMLVNWSAGLLALLSVFVFARTFLGRRAGVLSALLYYSLPLVGHFSFADMKIDNAVFFFGAMATLAMFLALMPDQAAREENEAGPAEGLSPVRLLLLAGIFAGLAFATKSTAIMVILALGAVLLGVAFHWSAFVGAVFFAFLLFSWQGVLSVENVLERMTDTVVVGVAGTLFTALCAIGTLGGLGYAAYKARAGLKRAALLALAFGAGFAIAVFPWVEHNTIEHGRIIPSFELSAPNRLSPQIGVEKLPPELAVDREAPECKPSGAKEELDRYWGFDHGWSHYLTLPWRTVMNIDAVGYYVTTIPAFLIFPLLLLLPYFWRREGKWLRWTFWATALMLLQWMFLANGIPWYGIGILLGLVVGLETLVRKAPDTPARIVAGALVGLSLVSSFGQRLWQFESQRNIFEYSMGKVSAEVLRAITIPYYETISDFAVQRYVEFPDRRHLFRVGTFIPYFIPRNLEVIGMNDHQLDVFNCLYQERDPKLTTERFKALGFNSIVFDTNTATIERDENGSLHKKVNAFVDYVNNPASGLQVVISDTTAGVAFILIP